MGSPCLCCLYVSSPQREGADTTTPSYPQDWRPWPGMTDSPPLSLPSRLLLTTLNSIAPYTVFAPTNDVFAAVPKADLDALLGDKAALSKVLLRHIVPKKMVGIPRWTSEVGSAEGDTLKLDTTVSSSQATATVTVYNIKARDGIVHAIDTII